MSVTGEHFADGAAVKRTYPMSREQEGLWLDDLVADGPSRYLEHWAYTLSGPLDVDALEWALGQVVERHEVLRSRLTEVHGEPVQIVTEPGPVRLARLNCPSADLPAELSRINAVPLDLDTAPLRPWLVDVAPGEFVLVVQFHHAVIDDWALNIFQRELTHFYEARVTGRPAGLEPLRVQAGELAVAQRAAGLAPADLEYWRERVRDAPLSCTVPPDRPGPQEEPHRNGRHTFRIGPEVGRSIRAACRALRTTPFTMFAGAMAVLLWQHGRPDEVIFGTPVSLRSAAEADDVIGCLTNPLPIRLAVSRDVTFRTLLEATRAEILQVLDHRAVPYSQLVRMRRHGNDFDVPPPFDAGLVLDDMRWEPFALRAVAAERIYIPPAKAKHALHFSLMADDHGGYAGFCDYDADVYLESTMERVTDRFVAMLAHYTAALDEPLGRRST
jgi:hypothetical protein